MFKPKMSSSELGALWTTYHKKTMILQFLEHFIQTSDNQKARNLMSGLGGKLHVKVQEMKTMIENEGAAVPLGFTSEDVNLDAPRLYGNGFDIMFSRILKEISMGMYSLHVTMSYRKDIIQLYKELTDLTHTYYNHFTQYLIEEDLLPHPTYINMPKSGDFVTDKKYTKGSSLLGDKRPLNTVEFGLLYHGMETNITGMQLMTGFAQCAKDKEVKNYFIKGRELSKEIINETEQILLQSDIQPPATPGGTITSSQESPFSERLMMYCTYLLCNFSIGGSGFGTGFSLRKDLNTKFMIFGKNTYEYLREGVSIMISNGWLEEPPKMDVNSLNKNNNQ